MDKKILMGIGILALCIILIFVVLKSNEKPNFVECKTDADCKLVRCVGAYCDNGRCVCPMSDDKLSRALEPSDLSKDASDLDSLMNKLEVKK